MTPRASRLLPFVTLILPLVAGCDPKVRAEFDLGPHHVSATLPYGWEHVDQGRRHPFRHGKEQVVLEDLGPFDRIGIAREVERARALWRAGKDREARTVLEMVPFPGQPLFATVEDRRAFWGAWSEVANASNGTDLATIEPRFDRLLARVAALPERSSQETLERVLKLVGEDARRDIASRSRQMVNGNSWEMIETWNRLSHDQRRSLAILLDGGDALVLHTEFWTPSGTPDELQRVLRTLSVRPRA